MKTASYAGHRTILVIAFTMIIAWALAVGEQVQAMPPHPDIADKIARGEIAAPTMMTTSEAEPGYMKINVPSAQRLPAATGPFRALCLLVDFSDKAAQASPYKFDTLVFFDRTGTVRDYYQEISFGQLDLVTINLPSSVDWKRAPLTYAYYVDNNYGTDSPYPHNSQKLCEDLVDLVDPVVNFADYDNDGDGFVDAVMIVHAGPGAEFTGSTADIWSHKWSISPRLKDGVRVFDYAVMPEFWTSPGDMTIGVFCHELGHVFGLTDLYDTDGSSHGTGYWSLMSVGSWNGGRGSSPAHVDAWSRVQAGWATPFNITTNRSGVSISAVETSGLILRLWTSGAVGDEYFLVENRQRTGYDAALPGSGMLIWHIDESVSHNKYEWFPGHTDFGNYLVALEQADNLYHLEKKQSAGDNGDPYPGALSNTSFSPVSSPNSDSYAASSSFVAVTNISPSAPTMTADFTVSFTSGNNDDDDPPAIPRLALGQNYPNPFNPSTSFAYSVPVAGEIQIDVYNLLGQHVATLLSGFHSTGAYTATWDGRDKTGSAAPSGIYLYRLTDENDTVVRKMMLIR